MAPWRRSCRPFSCRLPRWCVRSPPPWCARSPPWAATSRCLCPSPWPNAWPTSSASKFTHGDSMVRLLAFLFALSLAPMAHAQGTTGPNDLVLESTKGRVVIRLRADIAPQHAERLKRLAAEKFYDNAPFHRVIPGFMAQTGDGERGDGIGKSKDPDLPGEFSQVSFTRGVVGMARGPGKNSANSQFFIMFGS